MVLIKNLFQLVKIDQNYFLIRRERVELCGFLQNIVESIQPGLAEKKILLHVNCPNELIVFIDPERFQQVLVNILDDAKTHSDEWSEITIEERQIHQHISSETSHER